MKKIITLILSAVFSVSAALPAFAAHIFVGPEVEQIVSYDENGNKVISLIFDPAKTPEYMKKEPTKVNAADKDLIQPQETENASVSISVLDTPPIVGATLAKITDESTGQLTETYRMGLPGQCTWYVKGRFKEIYGIQMPYFGNAKVWLDGASQCEDLTVITDLKNIPSYAAAVYEPTVEYSDWPGHVVFVEYVEKDDTGKPINIYYSDANGEGDLRKGEFDTGYDGTVKIKSYEEFLHPHGLRLAGYIVPNNKI